MCSRPVHSTGHSDDDPHMNNHHISDHHMSFDLEDSAPTIEPALFPVMAVLLAQILDLDQLTATEGTSP